MYKCLTKHWIEGDILAQKGERLSIRLPEKDRRLIDSFLEQEGQEFSSISELFRIASKEFIDRRIAMGLGGHDETLIPVANNQITAIDGLILKGEFKSREAALHEIIRNYLKSLEWDKIDEVEKRILGMKYQMADARDTEKKIEDIYQK
jgi:metal-responsive CopG/Arc/MetJ family transcriptional regulator